MKKIGMIGGVGPESTVDYYRQVVSGYRQAVTDGSYPPIIINSIDLTAMVRLLDAGNLDGLAKALSHEIDVLARAGAEIGLLSSNTPHIVFNELASRSPIPLVSIVEAAAEEARSLGLNKLGLFGSRFTMQANFFQEVFSRHGMEIVVPELADINWIHEHYLNELVKGVFHAETRDAFMAIIEKLRRDRQIEALILGGTELPLLLRDTTNPIPLLDTARIHVDAVLRRALSDR